MQLEDNVISGIITAAEICIWFSVLFNNDFLVIQNILKFLTILPPRSGEERCETTLITAAKETNLPVGLSPYPWTRCKRLFMRSFAVSVKSF